jgi:hypothetical protein
MKMSIWLLILIKFPAELATQVLHEHQRTIIDYHYANYSRFTSVLRLSIGS